MADVTVEFGATDTGLEKTLKAVQDELTQLKGKVSSGELSMTELESTMKRIGQVTSMEKNIKAIGDSSTATSPKVEELNSDIKKTGDNSIDAGNKSEIGFGKIGIAAGIAGAAAKVGSKVIEAAFDAARQVVEGFGQAIELGGRLTDLSSRTGETAGKLLVLEKAFTNTGVSSDAVGTSLNKMQKMRARQEELRVVKKKRRSLRGNLKQKTRLSETAESERKKAMEREREREREDDEKTKRSR
jgi:hypothetical protein